MTSFDLFAADGRHLAEAEGFAAARAAARFLAEEESQPMYVHVAGEAYALGHAELGPHGCGLRSSTLAHRYEAER